jgi:hypothetical protein
MRPASGVTFIFALSRITGLLPLCTLSGVLTGSLVENKGYIGNQISSIINNHDLLFMFEWVVVATQQLFGYIMAAVYGWYSYGRYFN